MKTILVASSKGGAGKTTLATNLAAYFALDGKRTVLVDADPQHSSTRWAERRAELESAVLPIDASGRRAWRAWLPEDAERVVVDAPAVLRVERLIGTRGMSRDEAEARVWAQASDAERLEVADVVLDGTGSDANLRAQIDDLWARLAAERAAEAAAEQG